METAAGAEVLWCLAALACTAMTASNCREAWLDWRACRIASVGAPAMIAAATELESQASYLLVQVLFLAVGVGALLTPEPRVEAVGHFQDIAAAALVICEVVLAARSGRVRWRRHQLDTAILEAEIARREARP